MLSHIECVDKWFPKWAVPPPLPWRLWKGLGGGGEGKRDAREAVKRRQGDSGTCTYTSAR